LSLFPGAYQYETVRMVTKLAVGIAEAAQMLSVSRRTIQHYVSAKLIPARKIGRRTLITVKALEAFLRTDHASPVRPAEGAGRQ
jgi:excisionase family DNA binding protein